MGHEDAEGIAHVGVRVEPPVRLGRVGRAVDVPEIGHVYICMGRSFVRKVGQSLAITSAADGSIPIKGKQTIFPTGSIAYISPPPLVANPK